MTESKSFKRRVRERMDKTGESYTSARANLDPKRSRVEEAKRRLASTEDRIAEDKLKDATGKSWDQWFALLDRWGAKKRKHPEIARYLIEDKKVPGWWAQTITVWYQRSRGLRLKHQQADGFSISVTKTIGVPIAELFDAVVDDSRRKKWLKDGEMTVRTAQDNLRSARFNWDDGATRVVAGFIDKGPDKSAVAIAHERLPDADEAERAKVLWRERLGALKEYLER